MDYKRQKQISELDLNSFRQIEINKITTSTTQTHKKGFVKEGVVSIFLMSMLFLVLLGVFISSSGELPLPINPNGPIIVLPPDDKDDDEDKDAVLHVSQISDTKYMVRYEDALYHFELDFEAHIVYQGYRESYNELFDMKMNYVYAPEEVQETVDVEFDIFKLDEYRFFLDVSVNANHRYMEVSVYPPNNGYSNSSLNLDIINFTEDITAIYELIEQYPPIFIEERYGLAVYDINPLITEIEDQRMIENYTEYVTTNYREEEYYGTEFSSDASYYKVNSIIILDDENQVEGVSGYFQSSDNEIEEDNIILNSFNFLPKDEEYLSMKTTKKIDYNDSDIVGRLVSFDYDNKKFKYLILNLEESNIDLSLLDSVKYEYHLKDYMENSEERHVFTLPATFFGGLLVIEPLDFPITELGFNAVAEIHITLYDNQGIIIYEFDLGL